MYQALKSLRPAVPARLPVTAVAAIFAAIVLSQSPVAAQELHMDHENVTVEPIEGPESSPEVSAPALQEADAAPATGPEIMNPEVASQEPAAGEAAAAPQLKPAQHETAAAGPEVETTPAEAPLELGDDPLQAAQSQTAEEVEPVGNDPMMEAAQAHEEPAGSEPDAASTPAAAPAKKTAGKADGKKIQVAAVAPDDDKVDIFDQWAHSKFEARKEKAPHPLAAQFPDDFVVVCEAGCAQNPVEVVYQERRDARGPVNEKPLKAGNVAGTSAIDCVGGCYDARHAYNAVPVTWDPSKTVTESEWMSNAKKTDTKKKADSSGRWFDRIN